MRKCDSEPANVWRELAGPVFKALSRVKVRLKIVVVCIFIVVAIENLLQYYFNFFSRSSIHLSIVENCLSCIPVFRGNFESPVHARLILRTFIPR